MNRMKDETHMSESGRVGMRMSLGRAEHGRDPVPPLPSAVFLFPSGLVQLIPVLWKQQLSSALPLLEDSWKIMRTSRTSNSAYTLSTASLTTNTFSYDAATYNLFPARDYHCKKIFRHPRNLPLETTSAADFTAQAKRARGCSKSPLFRLGTFLL